MADTTHTFVETRGFTTHVAQGPPLLLLHGWPEFWATWEPMFDRLGDRYRLIAPDFRGFGESGNPSLGCTDQAGADVLADDIAALMDKLGIPQAGFVGHDVGAFAMQRLALNHPDRVAGLFFFNCATHGVGARFREPRQINEICDWIDVVGEYFENVEAGIAEDAGHFVHYETPDPGGSRDRPVFPPNRLSRAGLSQTSAGSAIATRPRPAGAGRPSCRCAAMTTGWPPRRPCSSSPSAACRRRAPRSGVPARG